MSDNTTPDASAGTVDCEVHGHTLVIRINRPAKLNGFTPVMMRGLSDAYTRLERDDHLRVGVLCAHGKHFTAGLDLPTIAPIMRRGERLFPQAQVDPFELGLEGHPRRRKPMVVAVKGITYTLGIELMLAADVVVAADDCRFSQLEVKRGIMATGGATLRMAQRAGAGNALLHLLTGDEFDAAEALRLNFVQKVVPAGQEFDEAMRLASLIAEQAPLAVQATIQSVRLCVEQGPLVAANQFVATQSQLSHTEDAAEGVASFKERRSPQFKGC